MKCSLDVLNSLRPLQVDPDPGEHEYQDDGNLQKEPLAVSLSLRNRFEADRNVAWRLLWCLPNSLVSLNF